MSSVIIGLAVIVASGSILVPAHRAHAAGWQSSFTGDCYNNSTGTYCDAYNFSGYASNTYGALDLNGSNNNSDSGYDTCWYSGQDSPGFASLTATQPGAVSNDTNGLPMISLGPGQSTTVSFYPEQKVCPGQWQYLSSTENTGVFWNAPQPTVVPQQAGYLVRWPIAQTYGAINIMTAPWSGNSSNLSWSVPASNLSGSSSGVSTAVVNGINYYQYFIPSSQGDPIAIAISPSSEPIPGAPAYWWSPTNGYFPIATLNPPQINSFLINNGATTTTTQSTTLTINASEPAPAGGTAAGGTGAWGTEPGASITAVNLSNDGSHWTQYTCSASGVTCTQNSDGSTTFTVSGYKISPTNGTATVYAQPVDSSGQAGQTSVAQIYFNLNQGSTPPNVALLVDGGAQTTTSANVSLNLQVSGGGTASGNWQMRFSSDGQNWTSWQPFAATATYTLPAQGEDTVYAEVQNPDGAIGMGSATIDYSVPSSTTSSLSGGTSSGTPYPSFITLNTSSGNATMVNWTWGSMPGVPQGAGITSTPGVTFDFSPAQTPSEMRTSVDGSAFGPWVPYQPSASITLPNNPGIQNPAVQFKMPDGTVTPIYSLPVVYDPLDPKVTASWQGGVTATTTGSATLLLRVEDPYMSSSQLLVTINGGAFGHLSNWKYLGNNTYAGQVTGNGSVGQQQFNITISDPIGNQTTVTQDIWYTG